MKKLSSSIVILGLVLSVGFVSTVEPVVAQPTKTTDGGQVDYYAGDKIDIELTIPGGTDLFVQPVNVVILLDRSNSMQDKGMNPGVDPRPRIDAAIDAINEFLDAAETVGGVNKPRVALATFGTEGYWEINFTTAKNYRAIRNRLPGIKDEMANTAAGDDDFWECTSYGEGVKKAVDKLVADADTNPSYIIVIGDGAENGKNGPDLEAYPPAGFESRFIEETDAIEKANDNNIKIHSVGLSNDVGGTLEGINLGNKCGKAYQPKYDGICDDCGSWRSGESHLENHISAPTGGSYERKIGAASLIEYFESLFKRIATDYEITAYERFYGDDGGKKHAYLNPLHSENHPVSVWGSRIYQVEIHGDGCLGDGNEASKRSPDRRQIEVKWNSIPQGETRCIIIHTTVTRGSPAGFWPINYGDAQDWYYIEIASNNGEKIWKVEFNQWEINVLSSPWLKTDWGNVGSKAAITMKSPIPRTASTTSDPWAMTRNASYLVTANGLITKFTSAKEWLLESYDPILHGPAPLPGGGYDYYGWLSDKYQSEIKEWTNDEAKIAGRCPDHKTAANCFPTSGFWRINKSFSITNHTDRGVGTDPTIFFVKSNLNLNDLSLHTTFDTYLRPMIFVVGGNVNTNVVHDDRITQILRTFLGYDGPDIPCAYYKGFFFVNGRYDVGESQGMTTIHGSMIANDLVLRGDIGKHDPALNELLPSEWFTYDPAILWYFRDLLGEAQTSFKEIAP